jgi:hypothetical protein
MNLKNIITNKASFLLGVGTLFSTMIYSQETTDATDLQLNTITTAVPFVQITPDSRSGAMGDVGTALSPSSSSLFWNTSMLSFSEDDSEVSLSYSPWLQNLASDINLSHLAGFVRVNDRQSGDGLKLSNKAYELLNFSRIEQPMVTIFLDN